MTSLVKKENKNKPWSNWFARQLWIKLSAIVFRALDFIRLIPVRLVRIGAHFGSLFYKSPQTAIWSDLWPEQSATLNRIITWHLTLFIYLLELFGIGEIYETITDLFKFNSRPLTEKEISIAKTVYGNQINCLLYTSPSPRDRTRSRMPSSA